MLVYLLRQRPPSPCNLTVTRVTSRSLHCDLYSVQDPLTKVWGWRIQSCKAYFLHYLSLLSLNVSLSSLLHSLCPLEVFTYSVLTVHELMQIHSDVFVQLFVSLALQAECRRPSQTIWKYPGFWTKWLLGKVSTVLQTGGQTIACQQLLYILIIIRQYKCIYTFFTVVTTYLII